MAKTKKVTVSERAVLARINRNLAKDYKKLRVSRSEAMRREFGRYYLVNEYLNRVINGYDSPEFLARELGVLKPYEKVEADR